MTELNCLSHKINAQHFLCKYIYIFRNASLKKKGGDCPWSHNPIKTAPTPTHRLRNTALNNDLNCDGKKIGKTMYNNNKNLFTHLFLSSCSSSSGKKNFWQIMYFIVMSRTGASESFAKRHEGNLFVETSLSIPPQNDLCFGLVGH